MKILLVVADSVRADALSCYGGKALTRNLDSLAGEGAFFAHCYASGGWTVPSVNALITGRYPHRVGGVLWRHGVPDGIPTLQGRFARAGCAVSSFPFSTRFMFRNLKDAGVVTSSQDLAGMIGHIRAGSEDEFHYVHYWWTHAPYLSEPLSHERWKEEVEEMLAALRKEATAVERIRARYRESVLYFDREVLPRLVDAVTAGGGRALIVVTADHGEDWGSEGGGNAPFESIYDLHGRRLTEAACRVPLMFWGTGVPRLNEAVGGLCRGIDVPVTLASLAGLDPVPDVDGEDLSRSIRSGRPSPVVDALTVSPHNTFEETVVPREPERLWRLWSYRNPTHRCTWDRTTDSKTAHAFPPGTDEGIRIEPAEAPPRCWERIEESARAAVGAPVLDEEEDEAVAEQLRGLGYFQ